MNAIPSLEIYDIILIQGKRVKNYLPGRTECLPRANSALWTSLLYTRDMWKCVVLYQKCNYAKYHDRLTMVQNIEMSSKLK